MCLETGEVGDLEEEGFTGPEGTYCGRHEIRCKV